jgi:hypothetical protein
MLADFVFVGIVVIIFAIVLVGVLVKCHVPPRDIVLFVVILFSCTGFGMIVRFLIYKGAEIPQCECVCEQRECLKEAIEPLKQPMSKNHNISNWR